MYQYNCIVEAFLNHPEKESVIEKSKGAGYMAHFMDRGKFKVL